MSDETPSTAGRAERRARGGSTPQVRALDYRELRELAEASAGVENQSVDFYFPEGRVLRRAAPEQKLSGTDVLVPVYNRGKHPRNRLWLATSDKAASIRGRDPLEGADAVFWSDAAVHKFLIPYAASFAGESAATFVELVKNAWNNYPQDEVTVYALVHVTSTRTDVDLDPSLSLLVAYAEKGETQVRYATVPVFLDSFPPVPPVPPRHEKVDYRRGADTAPPPRPDYAQLRAMAEWAASLRDEHWYFVFRPGERGFKPPTRHLPELEPGEIVVPTYSPTVPLDRPILPGVFFQAEGTSKPVNLAGEGDALFWSSGSIEQFLVPYYASRGGLQSLPDLADIATTWEATGPGRSSRAHSSHSVSVDGGGPGLFAQQETEVQVYGLIHLPTSQWTEVDAAFTVARFDATSHFGMVSLTRGGATRLHRPRHLRGRR